MVGHSSNNSQQNSGGTGSSPCQPVSSSTMMCTKNSNVNNNNSSSTGGMASSGNSSGAQQPHHLQEPHRCVWCRESKRQLNYVLPTQHGKKECCSERCLLEFRRAYNKGTCGPCSNCECIVRFSMGEGSKLTHGGKEHSFCTPGCLDKYRRKNGIASSCSSSPSPHKQVPSSSSPPASVAQQSSSSSSSGRTGTPPVKSSPPPPPPPGSTTLAPATKKKQHDPNAMSKGFNWPEYLSLTNSNPAPAHCFKQHVTPPTNEFATDMKLEANDPRNITSTCIATVVGFMGPRIRLRLDGSDNANDFWRMVDSDEIQPIGTCEKIGGMLQPPLGFKKNASFWPMFLCKTLNGAQMAPDKCFKIEPPTPRFNLFKVGLKVEAVDRKNPHLICVATIGAVDRDSVHITFDGWRGAFDYWCKYDSREIFPVGWCDKANHPLQSPGNKVPLYGPSVTQSSSAPNHHHQQISSSNHHDHHHNQPTSPQQQPPPTSVPMTLHLHPSCDCGPYLDSTRVRSSPTMIGPANIQDVYNQFVQILRKCALKHAPFDKLVVTPSTDILEQGDFWSEVIALTERFGFCDNFVNDKAMEDEDDGSTGGGVKTRGPAKVRDCPKCGGGTSNKPNGELSKGVKRKSSSSSSNSTNTPAATPSSSSSTSKMIKTEPSGGGNTGVEVAPVMPVSQPSSQVLQQQQSTQKKQQQQQQHHHQAPPVLPPAASPSQKKPVVVAPSSSRPGVTDPSEWTVEQVIAHITSVDETMENYAELFRKHEIDGKAMLLLNSDMMMRYMSLKLGPALKICNIIGKLKSKCGGIKNGSNGV